MTDPCRFVIAQRGDVDGFPPVRHQAGILAEHGTVTVIDTMRDGAAGQPLDSQVRRVRIRSAPHAHSFGATMLRVRTTLQFSRAVRREIGRAYRTAIAFEPEAATLLLGARRRGFRIVHLHELPGPSVYSSGVAAACLHLMRRRLDRADLFVVADRFRAADLQERWRLPERPTVVMNCPRQLRHIPESRLLPWLRERGVQPKAIVHYQGAIGSHHGLEDAVRSMPEWPRDSVFVIVGAAEVGYERSLQRLAADRGVGGRLFFVGPVPYDQIFAYAVGATLGLTLLDTSLAQWRYSAGASNKRFEYIALGLPQVTNEGPGIDELFVKRGVARAVRFGDVDAIGNAVQQYLQNDRTSHRVFEAARKLHTTEYNYETQFRPVLDRVLAGAS